MTRNDELLRQLPATAVQRELRVQRQLHGLSQQQLARQVGYSAAVIAQLESGIWYPRKSGFYGLARIITALGLTIEEFAILCEKAEEDSHE